LLLFKTLSTLPGNKPSAETVNITHKISFLNSSEVKQEDSNSPTRSPEDMIEVVVVFYPDHGSKVSANDCRRIS
jgi:hypothetical protein